MTLVVMISLSALLAAGSLVVPVAVLELRQGREAFYRAAIEAATEAALAQTISSGWVAATAGATARTRLSFAPVSVRPRLVVTLEAEAIAGDFWLLHGRALIADQAGNPLAAGRAGWVVRVGIFPPDSVLRARLIGRPWVPGFE